MIVGNNASRYTLAVKLTREGLRVMQTLVLSEKTCCSLWTLVGLVKRLLTLSPSVSHIQLSTETMARQLLLLPTTSRFNLRVRRYSPAHADLLLLLVLRRRRQWVHSRYAHTTAVSLTHLLRLLRSTNKLTDNYNVSTQKLKRRLLRGNLNQINSKY